MSSHKFANAGISNGNGFHHEEKTKTDEHHHGHGHGNGHLKKAVHSNGNQQQNGNNNANGNGNTPEIPLGQLGNVVNPYTYEIVKESADFILSRTQHRPKIGIICGSGLGGLADLLENKDEFPYENIPHFPVSTVHGHAGKLVLGEMGNVPVLCMQGRFHYYEGYPLWKVAMPVRVFKLLGVEIIIVTNAAGGLHKDFKVGDVMFIKDHLNFITFGGDSALRGPNDEKFGQRFIPLNSAYDSKLRLLAKQVATELQMDFIRDGVYAMVGGPSFETTAELRALRALGVDAIGMSTIPEVVTAQHCGMKTFAFSLITNECITEYDMDQEASHAEVLETAEMRQGDLKRFVSRLIPSIHELYLKPTK